jgi:S1-C subfamily serine protease
VSADGYIVTNYHVIEGADTITVTLSDGKTYEATVVGSDSETDLAVVDIEATNLSYLHFLDNALEQLNPLDTVVAVGNALALSGGPTWTTGVVSNLGRSIEESDGTVLYDLIQTDAAINEGNSGGPLVDMAGQVVGINTAIASNAENIGFAISTDTAIPVVESLIEEGKVTRPWLGVSVITVTTSIQRNYSLATDTGVLVAQVSSGSPAAAGGLRSGDVIVSIDEQQVDTADELQLEVRSHQVGDTLKITYWRGQEQKETDVTLGQAPS